MITAMAVTNSSDQVYNRSGLLASYIIGGFLLLVSLLGVYTIMTMRRLWLGAYSVLLLLLLISLLVFSVVLSGFVTTVGTETSVQPSEDNNWLKQFLNCTYQSCCPPCKYKANTAQVEDLCRVGSAVCSESSPQVQPSYCRVLEEKGTLKKCSGTLLAFHSSVQRSIQVEVTTVVIALFATLGLVSIGLCITCYFVNQKKVRRIMSLRYMSRQEDSA